MTCCTNWYNDPLWNYFGSAAAADLYKRYQSPLQGGLWCNCTFIAALSSIAWINPNVIRNKSTENPPYQFFFSDEATGNQIEVQIVPTLLVDNMTSFCGAKSAITNEVWPGIYEKAYAKFCLFKKGLITAADLKNPAPASWGGHYPCELSCDEWGGNPVTVMVRLTGGIAKTQTLYKKDASGCPDRTQPYQLAGPVCQEIEIFAFIKKNFCLTAPNKTMKAMAAWTFAAEENSSGTRNIPSDCHYTLTGIHWNHSYSILGVFSTGGINYIVLRDPWGVDPSDAAIIPKIYTGITKWQYSNKYFNISNSALLAPFGLGNNVQGVPAAPTVALSLGDGIFALKATEFGNYFEGVGWIE